MINFIGALVSSFVFGVIMGSGIKRLPATVYVILFVTVAAFSLLVGDYPFYSMQIGNESIPLNTVFISSFVGILCGSLILGGGRP